MLVRVAPPYGFAIALALLAGAVVLRAALTPLIGTEFASAPVFVAALVVTWYLGTAPAILIALLGYPAVKFFVRREPWWSVTTTSLAISAAGSCTRPSSRSSSASPVASGSTTTR